MPPESASARGGQAGQVSARATAVRVRRRTHPLMSGSRSTRFPSGSAGGTSLEQVWPRTPDLAKEPTRATPLRCLAPLADLRHRRRPIAAPAAAQAPRHRRAFHSCRISGGRRRGPVAVRAADPRRLDRRRGRASGGGHQPRGPRRQRGQGRRRRGRQPGQARPSSRGCRASPATPASAPSTSRSLGNLVGRARATCPPDRSPPGRRWSRSRSPFPVIDDQYATQATLSLPVSDYLYRLPKLHAAAKGNARSAALLEQATRVRVATDARVAYYAWARARMQADVAARNLVQAQGHLKDVTAASASGAASKADVLRVESQVATAELLLARARSGSDRHRAAAAHDHARHQRPALRRRRGSGRGRTAGRSAGRPRSGPLRELVQEAMERRLEPRALLEGVGRQPRPGRRPARRRASPAWTPWPTPTTPAPTRASSRWRTSSGAPGTPACSSAGRPPTSSAPRPAGPPPWPAPASWRPSAPSWPTASSRR